MDQERQKGQQQKTLGGFSLGRVKRNGQNVFGEGPRRGGVFGTGDDSEDEEAPVELKKTAGPPLSQRTLQTVSQALVDDPSVFDYDGVYEDLKAQETLRRRQRDEGIEHEEFSAVASRPTEGAVRKRPRYIQGLVRASEKRKVDLERALEKKVQREREAEGDSFGNKEQFVTTAFLERQKELLRLEAEEAAKEAKETGNMTAFYRDILESSTTNPVSVGLKNDEGPQKRSLHLDMSQGMSPEDQEREALLGSRGVQVNDSNEVVDKRQLLAGGLNISAKALAQKQREKEHLEKEKAIQRAREQEERRVKAVKEEEDRKRRIMRETQARRRAEDMERQRLALVSQKEAAVSRTAQDLAQDSKSRLAPELVLSAKARYLERKRREAEAATAGSATSSSVTK